MPRKTRTGARVTSHDPATGAELPMFVYYVPPGEGRRKRPKYRLKVPEAHCREQGILSKSAVFETLAELLDSKLYKKIIADDERHYRDDPSRRIRRTDAAKQASIQEHQRMLDENVPIHPEIHFRHQGAVWAVTRTFGTGWTFRATAHTYADAEHLHRACAHVRSVEEVVGDEATEADKHKKRPFSRKMLARVRNAETPREGEAGQAEQEEVEVEAVEVVDEEGEDEDEDEDEEDDGYDEEEEDVVEDVTVRSSRSGRECKRPNLYAKEAARPQQGKRKVARTVAVVGRPVLAVAVDKAGPSASGASSDAPIPVYDDADAMQSLKAIRERIAHLL